MSVFSFPILTAEQQYHNLASKGMIMDQDKRDIVFFLTHHSYFKIMLYFRPYRHIDNDQRKFHSGVTWSQILSEYNFDHDLRILLFSYIIYIENSFKNIFCQFSCQNLGNTRRENPHNFDDPKVFVESIQPILDEILLGKSRHEHVQKYIEKHNNPQNPPFRNMIEVFTLGQVVKMYKYLVNTQLKKLISKQYALDDAKFQNWLKIVVDARNICCHHNKLFDKKDWKIARVKIIDPMLDSKYDSLYHVCCLMHYLLNHIKPSHNFKADLVELLSRYQNVNHEFPTNWQQLWQ